MKSGVVTFANGGNSASPLFPTHTIEILDNSDNNSWITLENRMVIPIGVTPAWGKAPNTKPGFTAPALSRSTIPIDPSSDVYLSSQFPALPNDDGGPTLKTYQYPLPVISVQGQQNIRPANCVWALHDDGSPAVVPLYPMDSWVPTAIGKVTAQNVFGTNDKAATSYVGTDFTSSGQFSNLQYSGGAGPDSVIMAVSFTLADAVVPSGCLIIAELFGFYVGGASPSGSMLSDIVMFTPGDPIGTLFAMRCMGAQWVKVKFINFAGTESTSVNGIIWMGVPAN